MANNSQRGPRSAVVTGGAGFIGSRLTRALLARGFEVRVIDNETSGKREHVPSEARYVRKMTLGTRRTWR